MTPSIPFVRQRLASAIFTASRPASQILRTPARRVHALSSPRLSFARTLPGAISQPCSRRYESSAAATTEVEAPDYLGEGELKIFNILKEQLSPIKLEVQDVSGGCGSMYALDIVSEQFKGLTVIKQHRLVNAVLKDEIKKWHGVQLKTKAP